MTEKPRATAEEEKSLWRFNLRCRFGVLQLIAAFTRRWRRDRRRHRR